ncbi:2-hydroxyacyl-CoA dehydratase family protein [Sphingomonas sp. G-3-2-10]|uniref:2-hydroxyacyl-CoA dehydratase family protein n=1 Tax=Sphingomonas sp. G-3-2-10 TaxID=2728838 RepID=UPI001469EA12|nr:2-hydroxyacyl-CoA dehydratase family protein [Sphingomonas sp. G-3-2-10]NML04345.1 2-hydroxyacyl-CoA dehydratase [Sphingomonas sp. G-3-2-10]
MSALDRILAAARDPQSIAAEHRAAGKRVVWTLGWDIPRELVDMHGLAPVRLVPGNHDRTAIDALVGKADMAERGLALLAAIAAIPQGDAILISHADADQPQIFATLRELGRCGAMALPPVAFLDLLVIDREPTHRYNATRLAQTQAWLASLGGTPDSGALATGEAIRAGLRALNALRPRLTGTEAHALFAAAATLSPAELLGLLPQVRTEVEAREPNGPRVLLSGVEIETLAEIEAIEAEHGTVIGEDHGWGESRLAPLTDIARWTLSPSAGCFASSRERGERLAARIAETRPDKVVHYHGDNADTAAWETKAIAAAVPHGTGFAISPEPPAPAPEAPKGARPAPPPRSRKSLKAIARFGAYQRDWFAEIRAQAAAGDTFAAVNANSPQEMLRALGIPFVVNQWWASIVAAKQQSARYATLLAAAGLPPAAEAYSAQGAAAALDHDAEKAPWGGLPQPDVLGVVLHTDAGPKLFEAWSDLTAAKLQCFQRTVDCRWEIPIDWWDGLAEDWDHFIEGERLDLFEAELKIAIAELEQISGKAFDPARLAEVMDLVNEQEDYYRETRDLVARTVPAPISVVDQMPATMVPQWHRGTLWGRDAAKDFYEEVVQRAADGDAACPNERIRLMFVGRGVWGDMGFYQRWEESHGAVFVCSMYLSLAADGYIRRHDRGRDPLRALAARFVTMGDELRMATWAGAWNVKEALLHQVDGAMALSDADPLVLRALREAGIPVLELDMDNYVRDPGAEEDLNRRVVAFLEGPAAEMSAKRLGVTA